MIPDLHRVPTNVLSRFQDLHRNTSYNNVAQPDLHTGTYHTVRRDP
jgi:hypothetical protein